jgi:uncharacterized protein YciI
MRIAILLAAVAFGCSGGSPHHTEAPAPVKPFQMRSYVVVLLQRGPAWTAEKTPETARIFAGHMANIKAMAAAGKLVLAGPFEADASRTDAFAGLYIFDTTSMAEVDGLLAGDPAVTSRRLVPVVYPWYGPAGLTYDGKGHEDVP